MTTTADTNPTVDRTTRRTLAAARKVRAALLGATLLSLAFPALTPWPARATWPTDPNVNLALCNASGSQRTPVLLPDDAGGAFVAWWDYRAGLPDIYVQRMDQAGVPRWTANGVAAATGPGAQWAPGLCSDGTGGCIVAWADSNLGVNSTRIFAQRLDARGGMRWTPGGILVTSLGFTEGGRVILEDGAGGAFLVWSDDRGGDGDIYAQRLDGNGTSLWTTGGVALCTAPGDQLIPTTATPRIVSDDAGGFIVTWYDQRTGIGQDDIYAQRVSAAGAPLWGATGVAVCTAAGAQEDPTLCTNGLGGAFVTWTDPRNTIYRVYVQQVSVNGATLWTTDGIQPSVNGVSQSDPRLVTDGSQGAILAWLDNRSSSFDYYAQRIDNSGAPQWSPADVPVVTHPADQFGLDLASDGAGGAVASWRDERSGLSNADVYAQRLNAYGATMWAIDGVGVSTAAGNVQTVRLCPDATGGAILAWRDYRSGDDVYAQRVSGDGTLGGREPRIAGVPDVGPDQGGRVRVLWDRSDLDAGLPSGIESYSLWRRITANAARRVGPASFGGTAPVMRFGPEGAAATYWEYVVTVPAIGEAGYGYTVATDADSMAGLTPWSVIRVMAKTWAGAWHSSAPDSGYSVDNLAPGMPQLFAGSRGVSGTTLHWSPSQDPDLQTYRLYRGPTADFVPDAGTLLAAVTGTIWTDPSPDQNSFYKLGAVDVHGNAGPTALLAPEQISGVPDGRGFGLSLRVRNPVVGGGPLHVQFVLPDDAPAKIVLVDVSGRRLVERPVGSLGAGPHEIVLAQGLASGVYYVRLSTEAGAPPARSVTVVK